MLPRVSVSAAAVAGGGVATRRAAKRTSARPAVRHGGDGLEARLQDGVSVQYGRGGETTSAYLRFVSGAGRS